MGSFGAGGSNPNNMSLNSNNAAMFNQGNQLQGGQSVQQSPSMNMRMPENEENKATTKESKKPGLMNQTISKSAVESTPVMMDKIPVNNGIRKETGDTKKQDNEA